MNNLIDMLDNKSFYPTPQSLIDKMIVNDVENNMSILEPSAGKGDIVKRCIKTVETLYSHRANKLNIDCIEKDENLQHILRGQGYRVIHDDFLTFQTYKSYDLIVMNPPFNEGDKHLLKALEIQKNGGKIICILNAETIKNPYSNIRKDLISKLNEYNAEIEFLQDQFVSSERTTDVEIALVRVKIERSKEKDKSYIFEELYKAKELEEEEQLRNGELAVTDFLENLVSEYKIEVEGTIKLIKEYNSIRPYMSRSINSDRDSSSKYYTNTPILTLVCGTSRHDYIEVGINDYLPIVRKKYWNYLLTNDKFIGMLTSNLQEDYRRLVERMQDYDFTLFNIKSIQLEMSKSLLKGVEDTILTLFDDLTRKYHYHPECDINIHYYNGWKTNDVFKINNKKVIIPYTAFIKTTYGQRVNGSCPLEYYFAGYGLDKLKDIEKVLNYLDGGLTKEVDIDEILKKAATNQITSKISCKYFDVTFYKKGTCHIAWTCKDLINKFNIYGSQKRGWLPPSYGKKSYSDLNKEEKEVIDNFQGEMEYEKVIQNTNYYLVENNQLLLTTT